jgi:RIO kinase 2
MSRVEAYPMTHIREVINPREVYVKLMQLIIRLAENGLIHGDFNEFNLMIDDEETITLIDFPQMISIDHPEANFYFNRDVECIQTYFDRKYQMQFKEKPALDVDIERTAEIDKEIKSSVFMREAIGEENLHELDLVEITNQEKDNEAEGEGEENKNEGEGEGDDEETKEQNKDEKVDKTDNDENIKTNNEDDIKTEGEGNDETGMFKFVTSQFRYSSKQI